MTWASSVECAVDESGLGVGTVECVLWMLLWMLWIAYMIEASRTYILPTHSLKHSTGNVIRIRDDEISCAMKMYEVVTRNSAVSEAKLS